MAKISITKELSWKELALAYPIINIEHEGKTIAVNKLKDAIDSGALKAVMQACADELHNGDISAVVKAIRKNLSSQQCNMRKAAYNPNQKIDWMRYELLDAYTASLMPTKEAYWKTTVEEIDALFNAGNLKGLQSVYDCMMSTKSKYPEQIVDMDEFKTRLAHVSKMRSSLEQQQKNGVSTDLISKITSGKKLTKEEAELVAKLLSK